ncbi:MAG: CPBP family intramembrane metalloprotease [Bacteroidales bacterium]|nr:CPBP family intramembrane metalloprotease [Bacteroidales bacterium]
MARRGNLDILSSYSWYTPGPGGILALVLFLLGGALLGAGALWLLRITAGEAIALRYGTLFSYPLMFLPAMIYARHKSLANRFSAAGIALDSKHFGRSGVWVCALVAVAGVLALGFCADGVVALLPPMPEELEALLASLTEGNVLINFLCVGIFAPLFEEWLCRGMILRGLLHTKLAPGWAITLSALFFAAIHLNPWQAVPAFLFGGLFGYVYFKTGSLKLTMLMHGVNNTFALVCAQVDGLQDIGGWQELLPGPGYRALLSGCILMLALVCLHFAHIPLERTAGNCDETPAGFA